MRRLATVATFLCITSIHAQPSCPTVAPNPYGVTLATSCDPCLAGQPVTFTLVPIDPPPCQVQPWMCPYPYSIQGCDTVAWDFGDGASMTVNGSASATHTYASGNGYDVTVTITNAKSVSPSPRSFEVTVGNSSPTTITVSLPTTISESAGALLVTLTRSGDLNVPSAAQYRIMGVGGTERIALVSGEVHFAAGDTQRVLSFPFTNDAIFKGKSLHSFQLESDDGTLLAGLPKVPAYPSQVMGRVEVEDDDRRPHVRLHDVKVVEGNAGFTLATVKATLDVPSGLSSWFRGGITALGNDFYQGLAYVTFGFDPGQTTAQGTVWVKGDVEPEPDEALTFALDTTTMSDEAPIIERGAATLTILNDDIGFGQSRLWINVGGSTTLPVDLGTPLADGAKVTFTADTANLVSLTPSLNVGASMGTIKIDAIRGGDTLVTARVESPDGVTAGTLAIDVFQPSVLLADPAAVHLRVGEVMALRVSFAPAQPSTAAVSVQPQEDGIVAVLDVLSQVPSGGEAVVKLRGLAPGKTSLIVYSPGQASSLSLPVEVVPGATRRRAAKP